VDYHDDMTHLEAIHFLLTYRCTYSCDHCFLWGDPEQQGTMTLAQVTDVIDQAVALGGVDFVYFEGGEPTMYSPVLIAAARHARKKGLDFGVVTNCHWAESVDDAKLWLQPLKELDIADFSLSSYAYFGAAHEQEELLRNAIVAAQQLDLPMAVLEVGAPADLADLGVACGDPGAIMYKGRAAVTFAPDQATRRPKTLTSCPYEELADPERCHVGADGELQVCQGISAGNIFATPGGLAAVAAAFDPRNMPVFADLLRGGPWELARAHGVKPARELYADECHLCFETRLALRARYPRVLAPDQAYGVVGTEPPARPTTSITPGE
jgi:hypothetical protein